MVGFKIMSELDRSITDNNKNRYDQAITLNDVGHRKYLRVDFDDAIADYTQALNLYPNLAVAYYNRGTVHYRLGDLDPALQDLKRAVHLDPNNPVFREGLQECQRLITETKTKGK